MFLKTVFHEKVPGLLGEMAHSRTGAGKCKMSLKHHVPERKCSENDGDMSRGPRSQLEGAPTGQTGTF